MSLLQRVFPLFFTHYRFPECDEYIEIVNCSESSLIGCKGVVKRSKIGYLNLCDDNKLIVITLKEIDISFKDNTGKVWELDRS